MSPNLNSNVWTYRVILIVDVKSIEELSSMSPKDTQEYLQILGDITTVEDIILMMYNRLGLITFYTGSEKECNAWSVVDGLTVQEAAGVIHTDLMNNFISADVVNLEKMLDVGGWVEAKEHGLVANKGKDYLVRDGDYLIVNAGR